MANLQKIVIMAGGTGGHVFPGLAIAEYCREHHIAVHWLGTMTGIEATLIPQSHIPIEYLSISGLRGKNLKTKMLAPFRLSYAIWQACRILYRLNPDVVLGLGGFVSGPGGIASLLLRKKLIIHEQNALPGLTNWLLSHVASKTLTAFPNTFPSKKRVMMVGNPVRSDIAAFLPPTLRWQTPRTTMHLLVLGGSLGAKKINDILPAMLATLPPALRPKVTHQTGKQHVEVTKAAYQKANVEATIVPFIEKMSEAYAWADFVICRAGALTISELCAVGLGAILIPYPYATDDHQTINAQFLVNHQAGICLPESELTIDLLRSTLQPLLQSTEKRLAMAEAAYTLRHTDATKKIAQQCEEVFRE